MLVSGSQFLDIGFLTHISDPDDYAIELLQFTFEGKPMNYEKQPAQPLLQQPVFGLITLRVSNIEQSLKYACTHTCISRLLKGVCATPLPVFANIYSKSFSASIVFLTFCSSFVMLCRL